LLDNIELAEFELLIKTINNLKLDEDWMQFKSTSQLMMKRQNTFPFVSEVYFRAGNLLLVGAHENILD